MTNANDKAPKTKKLDAQTVTQKKGGAIKTGIKAGYLKIN